VGMGRCRRRILIGERHRGGGTRSSEVNPTTSPSNRGPAHFEQEVTVG
jgi:hypothetical protein